jgi:hypothetical protein
MSNIPYRCEAQREIIENNSDPISVSLINTDMTPVSSEYPMSISLDRVCYDDIEVI